MGIYSVKQKVKNYINSQIFVERWGLTTPINVPWIIDGVYYPASSAVVTPVSDYNLGTDGIALINCEATFGVDICWRFNGDCAFEQLPIDIVENLVDWVSYLPVSSPGLLGDHTYEAVVESTPNPCVLSRADSEDRDWLIYGFVRWRLRFRSKPIDPNDLGVLQPDTTRPESRIVTSIGVVTWGDYSNPINNPTLDKSITMRH